MNKGIKFYLINTSRLISLYLLNFSPIILAVIIVITSWHKDGTLIAFAETGLPFYNVDLTLSKYKDIWFEDQLGYVNPFFRPFVPILYLFSLLSSLGVSSSSAQFVLFIFVSLVPILTLPLLCRILFEKKNYVVELFAAGFYFFNLFVLTQIWQRFLYASIFLWSLLPLFLVLWMIWIKKKKLIILFSFAVINIIYSVTFGLIPSIFAVWIPALLYSSYYFYITRDKQILYRSLIGFIVWILVSLWWILPIWNIRNVPGYAETKSNNNIQALRDVSVYYPNIELLQLKQNYYFSRDTIMQSHYQRKSVAIYPHLIVVFVLLGILSSRKQKSWVYLTGSFVLSWFLIKGSNEPFGDQFYTMLYSLSSIFQTVRNPYEKLGVIFLLPYSLFFALGVDYIAKKLSILKYFFLITLALIVFYLLPLPLWKGWVFAPSKYVSVPSYYQEVNEYLNKQSDNRILHLPYFKGAGIEYTWGYNGEEPSTYLFDRPSVSALTSIVSFDEFYIHIQKYLENKNFSKILQIMNVGDIIFHNDVKVGGYHPYNLQSSTEYLQNWKDVHQVFVVGELEVYTYDKKGISWVYSPSRIHTVNSIDEILDGITSDTFDISRDVYIKELDIPRDLNTSYMQDVHLEYRRLGTRNFEVIVNNQKVPFMVVLSTRYHPLWKATIDNSIVARHFPVNGYANAWIIDKEGSFTINLSFDI
jgi:hypothetical protein